MPLDLHVTVVEDEWAQAKVLSDLLQKEIDIPATLIHVRIQQEYISFFHQPAPPIEKCHIYIIDIHLNTYFNGIDYAKKLLAEEPNIFVIFFTSDASKCIEAINQQTQPMAYLIKDTQPGMMQAQFKDVLTKISHQIRHQMAAESYFRVQHQGEYLYLDPEKILYIQTVAGVQKKTIVHTDRSEYLLNYRLIDIKKLLPNDRFNKNLKSVVINLSRIKSLNRIEGMITFDNDQDLYVGTKIIDKLKRGAA